MATPKPASRRPSLGVTCVFLSVLAVSSEAAVLHVSKEGDGSDPSTWAGAFQTVTGALASALPGDQVWVRSATYTEHIQLATDVAVYGGFAGNEGFDEFDLRDWNLNETIVAGGTERKPLFEGAKDARVDGLIFRGGLLGGGKIRQPMRIMNCEVSDNASGLQGAGLYISNATVSFKRCVIRNNFTTSLGGGVCALDARIVFDECKIMNNGCGSTGGGGLFLGSSICSATNCIIAKNHSYQSSGGGLEVVHSQLRIIHSSITGNESILGGTAIDAFPSGSPAPVSHINCINSIITGTRSGVFYSIYNSILSVPLLNGSESGSDNIVANPLFVSPNDYHLQANSPAIDAGTKVLVAEDIEGNPRPVDIPGHGQDETGTEFDCGAYEYQIPAPTPTATETPVPTPTMNPHSDIDQNGRVDEEDLLILKGDWGKTLNQ
jgi:hypothetical protein